MSAPDARDQELMQDAFKGLLAYDTFAANEFTRLGEDVDHDTRMRILTLVDEGLLTYFRSPASRRGASFLTSVITTDRAWKVMS